MKNLFVILCLMFAGILFYSCAKDKDLDCVEDQIDDCFCYEIYDPVCGCNNVTYSNDCYAECAGITDYTSGECDK